MLTLDILRKKSYAPFEMILVYRNDGELTEEFKSTGVPMFRVKPKRIKLGYLVKIRRLLKKEKIDVLHAQTTTNGVIGVLCTLFTNVKVVASFHGLLNSFLKLVSRHVIIWGADETIYVSDYVRDWYIHHTLFCRKDKCNVVYNGICDEKFDHGYPMPKALIGQDNNLRLGCVGNFVAERTQIIICKSLKLLNEQDVKRFEFYFIGKRVHGEEGCYDECVRYCEENHLSHRVHFLGSRGDVIAILQHLDGFVYSTNLDTFGIAVVEAMMAGIPVIVNDWEVMKEVTQRGKYAVLFDTGNEEDCSLKIRSLIDDIDYYQAKARSQAEEVRKLYSIENHILGLKAVYDKCIC